MKKQKNKEMGLGEQVEKEMKRDTAIVRIIGFILGIAATLIIQMLLMG